jgi:hypothetical protein
LYGRKAQKNDSLPGSLDMLILRMLSLRDLHGYGIVRSESVDSVGQIPTDRQIPTDLAHPQTVSNTRDRRDRYLTR